MAEKLFKNTRKQVNEALAAKYTVKKGDTLSKIARELGTTVEILAKSNRIADPDQIKEGQILLIPKKKEEKKAEKKAFTKAE
ncbi:MAG: LysM peptidoglycan-binding domain-containing protein [Erysipelotrichaceae bacterium]|jgi:LysM repeat protein|nr:LysM peptidoglycan-binding domain-containing protein [Erysipelotrichaceae bacterium]